VADWSFLTNHARTIGEILTLLTGADDEAIA
jgi:hypothetical protein